MSHLIRGFTQELPAGLRRSVYTAIVQAPQIVHKKWVQECPGGPFGCVVIVAAFGAVHEPITVDKVNAIIDSEVGTTKQRLGQMLMMPADTVEQCWREWDAMDDVGRIAFVNCIRRLLSALPPEDDNHNNRGSRLLSDAPAVLVRSVQRQVAMVCLMLALMPSFSA